MPNSTVCNDLKWRATAGISGHALSMTGPVFALNIGLWWVMHQHTLLILKSMWAQRPEVEDFSSFLQFTLARIGFGDYHASTCATAGTNLVSNNSEMAWPGPLAFFDQPRLSLANLVFIQFVSFSFRIRDVASTEPRWMVVYKWVAIRRKPSVEVAHL